MPNRTKVTESPLSCLQSIIRDFIDRDCPPHNSGSHHIPNRTKVTESPLSCLQSIWANFITRDCLPQTQAVTDHGIEPIRLLAILLARLMCDRREVNVHYHSTKRLWRNELTFFQSLVNFLYFMTIMYYNWLRILQGHPDFWKLQTYISVWDDPRLFRVGNKPVSVAGVNPPLRYTLREDAQGFGLEDVS